MKTPSKLLDTLRNLLVAVLVLVIFCSAVIALAVSIEVVVELGLGIRKGVNSLSIIKFNDTNPIFVILTDHATGVQYLSTRNGLTPRIDHNGNPYSDVSDGATR